MDYSYMAEQLNGEYREVFEKTEVYGVIKGVAEDMQDDLMMNLFDLLLTAQAEGKPVDKIVGSDLERFCVEYYQSYDRRERIKDLPASLYRFMWVVFGFGLLDFLSMDSPGDVFHTQLNITPYISGIVMGFLFAKLLEIVVGPLIFRIKIKPVVFYFGSLGAWIGVAVLSCYLLGDTVLNFSMLWILVMSGLYILVYLVGRAIWRYRHTGSIRSNRASVKEFEELTRRAGQEKIMLDVMLQSYRAKNRRLQKKNRKEVTPAEYTEKVRKEYYKVQGAWKYELLIMILIIVPFIVSVARSSSVLDTILFILLILALEGGIYFALVKAERNRNKIRKNIIDICDCEGISVIEYAMRQR